MLTSDLVTREEFAPVEMKLVELAQMYEALVKEGSRKVYTNEKAAQLLGVSRRTLQNWRDDGLIEFAQIKSKIYYTAEDVQHFIENNKVKSFKFKEI